MSGSIGKTEHTRRVMFIVASELREGQDLTDAIGAEPDSAPLRPDRSPREATWEMVASGSGTTDLSAMIGSVLDRVRPLRERLTTVCADADTTCFLRVVQYVGNDPVGPGFALGPEEVALLAELHATIDVDQYWLGPDDD